MKNKEIAAIFDAVADMLEIQGESPFRVNAYRNASRTLQELTQDVETLVAEGTLKDVKGFGKAMVEHVEEYLKTGKIGRHDELLRQVPPDLVKMLQVPGLGPKTVQLMSTRLGVETLGDFRRVMESGQLAELPGMGRKKVENIRRGYQLFASARERMTLGAALPAAEAIIHALEEVKGVGQMTYAGSLRRMRETIGDIDILASGSGKTIIKAFTGLPQVKEVLGAGETKASVRLVDDLQVDLRVVAPESWGAAP